MYISNISLGAVHDGIEQNGCRQDRYIMTADIKYDTTPENVDHAWYFSTCSTTQINALIGRITSQTNPSDVSKT